MIRCRVVGFSKFIVRAYIRNLHSTFYTLIESCYLNLNLDFVILNSLIKTLNLIEIDLVKIERKMGREVFWTESVHFTFR